MKKTALLLITALAIGLTGCGKSYSNVAPETGTDVVETPGEMAPEEGASLVIWEDSDTRIEYMEYVAEKFKEKYNVDVTVEKVADFSSKLIQDGPAGLGPDLLEAPHDQAGTLLTAGLVQPNDTTVEEVRTAFPATVSESLTYEDKLYGYPLTVSTYVMIYNRDLVEQAPGSFQDIIDFAQTFNNPADNKYALMWQVSNSYFSHAFIAGYGGYVFGNNGVDINDIGLNSDGAVQGLTYLKSLKTILDVNSSDIDMQIIDGLFASGKVAYTISGQWSVSQYQNSGLNVGVCVLPRMANGEYPLPYLGVQTLYVSSYTKYPNAAKLFAEMASSEEMLEKRYEITAEIPARISLMESDKIKSSEVATVFMQQAQNSVPMPSVAQMNTTWTPYQNAIKAVWDNDADPQEALNTCVDTIRSLME